MEDRDWTLQLAMQGLEHRVELLETRIIAGTADLERRIDMLEAAFERAGTAMHRAEVEAALNGLARRSEDSVKAVAAKVDTFGRTNWPLLVSLAGLLAVLTTGVWVVVGLKIEAGTSPLQAAIAVLQAEQRHAGQKPAP